MGRLIRAFVVGCFVTLCARTATAQTIPCEGGVITGCPSPYYVKITEMAQEFSDALGNLATWRLEFPNFAALAAYQPSAITTALDWAGAPVVAHTAGYYNAGDGGSATYVWNSSSAVTADGLYYITPGGGASGRWVLEVAPNGASVLQLGVIMDGVTATDASMNAAGAACSVHGTKLNAPGGIIILHADTNTDLSNCVFAGAGQQGWLGLQGGTSAGTTLEITGSAQSPFIVGNGVTMRGFQWYWPSQDGTVTYPPAITDAGGASTPTRNAVVNNLVLEDLTFVNPYDGVAQSTSSLGWGAGYFNNIRGEPVNDLIRLANTGNGFMVPSIKMDAGPWINVCGSACTTAVGVASARNRAFHIVPLDESRGGTININIGCASQLSGRYGFLLDAGATVAESTLCAEWDGGGTLIDASAAGASWATGNTILGNNAGNNTPFIPDVTASGAISGTALTFTGGGLGYAVIGSTPGTVTPGTVVVGGSSPNWVVNHSQTVSAETMTLTHKGNFPLFNMGASSELYLDGFQSSGAVGDFIDTNGSGVYLLNSTSHNIGSLGDGSEYSALNVTGGSPTIKVSNNDLSGTSCSQLPAQCGHVHGINTGSVSVGDLTIQNNRLSYFNDDITVQTAGGNTLITGNKSTNTVATSITIGGTGPVMYGLNLFDKPPIAVCGSGCTVAAGALRGVANVSGALTTITITLPFYPAPPPGTGNEVCFANIANAGQTVGCGVSGKVVTINASTSMAGEAVGFDALPAE